MLEFEPTHPNANIHGVVEIGGQPTCRVREKVLCTGCCWALHVDTQELKKEPGEMCPSQTPKKGCMFVLDKKEERPLACNSYHCSGDIWKIKNPNQFDQKERQKAYQRLTLCLLAAKESGEIAEEEFDESLKRLEEFNPFSATI